MLQRHKWLIFVPWRTLSSCTCTREKQQKKREQCCSQAARVAADKVLVCLGGGLVTEKVMRRRVWWDYSNRKRKGESMKEDMKGKRSLTGWTQWGSRHEIKLRDRLLFLMLAGLGGWLSLPSSLSPFLRVNWQPKLLLDSLLLQILVLRQKHGVQCLVFIVLP